MWVTATRVAQPESDPSSVSDALRCPPTPLAWLEPLSESAQNDRRDGPARGCSRL